MIRYITLSVYSMIITRVFIKLREKLLKYRYPEAQDKFIKSIGVDPVEYMYAVKCARVSDDMKIILWFEEYCDNGVRKMRYAEAGPSLGCVCDKLITKWCNDRLGTYGPYTFKFLIYRTTTGTRSPSSLLGCLSHQMTYVTLLHCIRL